MNDAHFDFRYHQPLGYELVNNKNKDENSDVDQTQAVVEQAIEYKQYLNLPKGFKIGG